MLWECQWLGNRHWGSMGLVLWNCPVAKASFTKYSTSHHVKHSIEGFDVNLITSAYKYEIQRVWFILHAVKLQALYLYYPSSLKTNFSGHWELPNLFLFVLVVYWLKVKVKLSAFTIYNVLTQTCMAEKELHVVFATTLAWLYSGHKVVFHPKGL